MRFGELLERLRVPRHQTDRHLQILRFRFFGQGEHLAGAGAIDRHWLLHEDVQPFLDRIAEIDPAERRHGREDRHVTRPQTVHRLLVGVKSDELPVFRHVHPVGIPLAIEVLDAVVEPILKDVGHGDEFDRAVFDRHRLARSAAASTAATDQGHADRVVLAGVDGRDENACQGRGGGDLAGILQKIATRCGMVVVAHRSCSLAGNWGRRRWPDRFLSRAAELRTFIISRGRAAR